MYDKLNLLFEMGKINKEEAIHICYQSVQKYPKSSLTHSSASRFFYSRLKDQETAMKYGKFNIDIIKKSDKKKMVVRFFIIMRRLKI